MKRVINKLEKFLKTKQNNGAEWCSPNEKDLKELSELIRLIIDTKWKPDYKGSNSVEFVLNDKTKNYPIDTFTPVPRDIEEVNSDTLYLALNNVSYATELCKFVQNKMKHKEK